MAKESWNEPRSEEGLQRVLERLKRCRDEGDLHEVANGLLALSFLVKWVRSDTDKPPFLRSHELAVEALAIFRKVDDKKGLVRALIGASALAPREEAETLLSEAADLANDLGSEKLVADVTAAFGRKVGPSDSKRAAGITRGRLKSIDD